MSFVCLGCKALAIPGLVIRRAGVFDAIMQPVLSTLPEFKADWFDSETAPPRRFGDIAIDKFLFDFGKFVLQ